MRPRSKYPPQTPAERQAKCRAIKKGTWEYCQEVPRNTPPGLTNQAAALPAPPQKPALPAPPITAIWQTVRPLATTTALPKTIPDSNADDGVRLSLPPAVAARLRSLVDRHNAGKALTTAERAEAQGLLDIAEYFAVQRLRHRLAA